MSQEGYGGPGRENQYPASGRFIFVLGVVTGVVVLLIIISAIQAYKTNCGG